MAEESGQERTEEPTAKRLEEARRRGQVPRSRELNTFTVLIAGVVGCGVFSQFLGEGLARIMAANFRLEREEALATDALLEHAASALRDGVFLLAPLLLVLLLAALVAPAMLGGWIFSLESLKPKFGKLNPLSGLRQILSRRALMELLKSLLKVTVVALAAWFVLEASQPELLVLAAEDLRSALADGLNSLWWGSLLVSLALAVLAVLDVPYQLWDHRAKLKMTLKEVRDEIKESEGRPEVKAKIRQLQRERAQRRMMEAVPKADVVITNPTHFAVALKYDRSRGRAPVVVAKGADWIAAQIRAKAAAAGVPLVEAPPLARALYYSTQLDQEIPQGLYLAVAQVLAYVYQLKAARTAEERPRPPEDWPVPEEYLRH
ncbi:MAG: flagellar biosynthesis protein FlhB [Methylohalobius sp.]|nr:flagellar biosynthesis protein FlhB [Methylohalobius sp.]